MAAALVAVACGDAVTGPEGGDVPSDPAAINLRLTEALTLTDHVLPSLPDVLAVRIEETLSLSDRVGTDFNDVMVISVTESLALTDAVVATEEAGVVILSPSPGTTVTEGAAITFSAQATDADGTDLSDGIAWSSNVDGSLGGGASISVVLSPGPHTVTASVTLSGGGTVSATVSVGVGSSSGGTLYGVDAGTDGLHRIEPVTGLTAPIGSRLGSFDTPIAMAVMPGSEEILVWSNSPSSELVSVDVCSGAGTSLGSYFAVDQVSALAARADGVLFGFTPSELFRIDMGESGRPLTIVGEGLPVRAGGADFTPDGRLFGLELTVDATARLVEVDPATGDVLHSTQVVDEAGAPVTVGVAGSLTWNPATGAFLASSIRGYEGVGEAFYDLSPAGVASNARPQTGVGDQGMGFRSVPDCAGAPPSVSIESPTDGAVFDEGTRVTLTGVATDPEDGTISSGIQWFSDLDGPVGSGATSLWFLSPGTHRITAGVMDTDGNSDLASITVVMGSAPEALTLTVREALTVGDGPEATPNEPVGSPILLRVQESIGVHDGSGPEPR